VDRILRKLFIDYYKLSRVKQLVIIYLRTSLGP